MNERNLGLRFAASHIHQTILQGTLSAQTFRMRWNNLLQMTKE